MDGGWSGGAGVMISCLQPSTQALEGKTYMGPHFSVACPSPTPHNKPSQKSIMLPALFSAYQSAGLILSLSIDWQAIQQAQVRQAWVSSLHTSLSRPDSMGTRTHAIHRAA